MTVRMMVREAGFRLTHHLYERGTMKPLHTHTGPHFVLVYEGRWEDIHDRHVRTLDAGELLFHPAGTVHQNGTSGAAEVIVVHLARSRMAPFSRLYGSAPRSVRWSFESLEGIPQRLRQETMRADPATPFIIGALITQLLAVGSRHRAAPETPRPPWLAAVVEHIDSSLGDPLSVTALASRANISPSHLAHAFPRAMGCTVGAYIRIARIRAAAAALRDPGLSIQEIAYRTGFYDQAHLCRAFKAAHGVTPGDYRTTV
jgi:AraC family transcriptional regulator